MRIGLPRRFIMLTGAIILLATTGCGGGGGGGGGSSEPAEANLLIPESTIDVDGLLRVSVVLREIAAQGIVVKVRFPLALTYELGTSIIEVEDENSVPVAPTDDESDGTAFRYLTYFIRTTDIEGDEGTLSFSLKGTTALETGTVELDVDLNDPDVSDVDEFIVTAPEFEAVDQASVRIRG